VQGFLRHYWDEFEYYVKHGRSLVEEQQGLAA
jgi:NADH-quinone oxidoreductase subunit F